MPVCFSLTDKRKLEEGPVDLNKVDDAICEYMKVKSDPDKWCDEWYNFHGLLLALGRSHAEINDMSDRLETILINNFIANNYTTDAWREFKY